MKISNTLIPAMLCLALTSCATGYHSSGLTGGYSDQKVGPNKYKITFKGNGFSSPEQTYQYAMKRGAEITLQHGYEYFSVLNKRNYMTDTTTYTTVGYSAVPITTSMPTSDITIMLLAANSGNAYNARKVMTQVGEK